MVTEYRYSAAELCDLLGVHPPTEQQRAIIEAPLEGVYRVVAGAGSGKTETMALRVVWLVANKLVAPHEVLGLTFTRKAAAELGGRIAERIRQLPADADDDHDVFQLPQVSTYNAFASRLFQDYAVYLGVDGDQEVAGGAAAWSLARRVVAGSDHPRLPELDRSLDQLTNYTWQLSQAISEHAVDVDQVGAFVEQFQLLRDLPPGGRGGYPKVDEAADAVALLPVLIDLVDQFREAKAERGMVEYSDQVRLGLEVARSAPEVIRELRSRHKVVLLDEYQDTSVLQTQLLATLFADHPVMSVGDPLQAIYGWRGASAANLDDFPRDFAQEWSATTFGLQISWRNPTRVLEAANRLCEPLRADSGESVGVLEPADHAPDGVVDAVYLDTLDQEADAVADWFAERLEAADDSPPSAALLLRERKHQQVYARALERRGIPVHILGIGGLLADPVVADLIAGLAVVHRRFANGELVRLLTSGRFRLGVADLFALAERARWLGLRDSGGGALDSSLDEAMRDGALGVPRVPLIDALDYLASKPDDHGHWQEFSEPARAQLREAAELIARQRRLGHEGIADQVVAWERATGLDIEWMSHPHAQRYRDAREAFFDAISQYQSVADEAGARGFLDWLEQAEWRDSLQPQSAPAEPGCVQILTIHGAKGLEWDLVAVGGLREGGLPGSPNEGYRGWLRAGVLPYHFRGDREFLPQLSWQGAETRKEVSDFIDEFRDKVRAHYEKEERRLAYVALTRSKSDLLVSGSFFTGTPTAKAPSVFLAELAESSVIPELPSQPTIEEAPEPGADDTLVWPGDPLGERRDAVEQAAQSVAAAIERGVQAAPAELVQSIDRLVDEENSRLAPARASWPVRIPASQFDRWIHEPDQMLQARLQPRPPTTGLAQQRGNQFHAWVESYFQGSEHGLLGDVDIDGDEVDPVDQDVESWKSAFEASEFSGLTPVALEREIHLPLAGHLIICKIDAVFERDGRIQIVDWKTGKMPTAPAELERKALQLALYRLAWAEWSGLDITTIDAVFWFSAADSVVDPGELPGRSQLEALIRRAKESSV